MQGNAGDSIEPSTMNYVFDMFGKSVAQMLQQSISQQTMIDELRAQFRSVQTQVTNICNTLEDFEDKIVMKVQEMRPTLYTRDGIPIDDALEMLQSKITSVLDKSQANNEIVDRLDAEIKQKVDSDQFDQVSKTSVQAEESCQELFLTVQTLQKELQKQRNDTDAMSERVMQMVQLRLEQTNINRSASFDVSVDNNEYVTRSTFDRELQKIRMNPFGLPGFEDSEKENNEQDQFDMLQMQQDQLEKMYQMQKAKLGENYDKLLVQLDNEEESTEIFDDFSIESDFSFVDTEPDREIEYRSISVDNEGNVDDEEVFTDKKHSTTSRRSIGLQIKPSKDTKTKERKKELLEKIKKKKEEHENNSKQTYNVTVDEGKIQHSILATVMERVEGMLVDFFTMQSGLKLDKNDAKTLVSQLSVVQQIKDDLSKMKILVRGKKDTVRCDQEMEIRITRNEFFNYLATIFPNNSLIQKCLTNLNNGLPPLKKDSPRARPRTSIDEESRTRHRQKQQQQQPNLVPARNSRLLALNQKFLRGADGRYYLRDMGGETSLVMTPNITGNQKKDVQPDDAFDFQPFQPSTAVPKTETTDRYTTSAKRRSRTPTDATD